MAGFIAQDVALGPAPTEQVGSTITRELPTVEAIGGGSCPDLAVRLPPGASVVSASSSDAGRFRATLGGVPVSREEPLAVPEDLRDLVGAIRLEPDSALGTALVIEPVAGVAVRRIASSDPGSLLVGFTTGECRPGPAAARSIASSRQPDTARLKDLLNRAEEAIRTDDLATADGLVAEMLTYRENAVTPRARELSGILAERAGRTAEAREIFGAFLADYPDHEAVPRITMRMGALDEGEGASGDAAAPGPAGAEEAPASPSPWRTSLRGIFSQYYLYDRSRATFQDVTGTFVPGFVDRRVNVDELLTVADATLVATNGKLVAEARASAGYVAEYRAVQLTGSDRNTGSYELLDQLYVSLSDAARDYRATIGRQKIYGLGVFGRFDGISTAFKVSRTFGMQAVVGRPVWSERQTSLNKEQWFYALSADFSSADDRFSGSLYWFDQRASGETDRQAIGAQFRARGEKWLVDGLIDYDLAFDTLNAAYLSGTVSLPRDAAVTVVGQIQHYPTLSLTNAILGQPDPRLGSILGLADVDTLRQVAQDRTLTSRSLTATVTVPLTETWRLSVDGGISSLSGDPGSLGVPAYLETGTEYRLGVQAVGTGVFGEQDTLILRAATYDLQKSRILAGDVDYRLPLGPNAYVAPRLRISRREQKDSDGSDTIVAPSVRAVWQVAPKVELEAQVGRVWRDEQYENYDWSGPRKERSWIAHVGYTIRF